MDRILLEPLSTEKFEALTATIDLPIEQSLVWDAYDRAVNGRRPWKRFAFWVDEEITAVIALTEFAGRGFRFLWAKNGPVWLSEPTPELERLLEEQLIKTIRAVDPRLVFVRLHAEHPSVQHHPLLQSVTYDRTVVIELDGRSDDELLAAMKKRGRRDLRKGLREQPVTCTEATGLSAAEFAEMYEVLRETAERDGFGLHPASVYTTMLESLGPDAARLFVGRHDGVVQAWTLVTVHDRAATAYYAASTAAGRAHDAPTQLYWHICQTLRDEGVRTFDLMGIGSELAPTLEALTIMKTKFSEEITEVPAAWDVAVRPRTYAALRAALHAKRRTLGAARRLLGSVRREA